MRPPARTRRLIRAGSVVVTAVLLAGCSAGAAPSPSTSPLTLRFAHIDNDLKLDPAAQHFMDEVESLSRGALRLSFVNECCGRDNDTGPKLIAGVASGDFDLGWAMTRGLEDLGVTSFQALSAPRLIDSYSAEKAVLAAGLETQILPGLSALKVTGLALEPGTLRRPISSKGALLWAADWAGMSFWSNKSSVSAATVTALGAVSTQVGNDVRDQGFDDGTIVAAENSVAWEALSQHIPTATISINEALWPRMAVVVANPAMLNTLSAQQRKWITSAATETSRVTHIDETLDTDAVATICGTGGHFATADHEQLASIDAAIAPIYAQLRSDPTTNALIDRITALKPVALPDEYTIPPGCEVD